MNADYVQDKFPEEDAAVLRLVNGLPWGDLCEDIIAFEKTLRTLLYATGNDATSWRRTKNPMVQDRWEKEGLYDVFGDGLAMTPDEVDALSEDHRRALVAHLVYLLDFYYIGSEAPKGGLAKLVRGLNDIVCLGDVFEES